MKFGSFHYIKFVFLWWFPMIAVTLAIVLIEEDEGILGILSYILLLIPFLYFLYVASILTPLFNSFKSIGSFGSLGHVIEMYIGSKEAIKEAKDIIDIKSDKIDLIRYSKIRSKLERYSNYFKKEADELDLFVDKLNL